MLPLRRPAGWMLSTARSVAVSRRTIVIGRDHGNFNTVLLMVRRRPCRRRPRRHHPGRRLQRRRPARRLHHRHPNLSLRRRRHNRLCSNRRRLHRLRSLRTQVPQAEEWLRPRG